MTTEADKIKIACEALQAVETYIRQNHNANGGWWNDPHAWKMIEKIIKPALKALR